MKTKLMYTNIWQLIDLFLGCQPEKDVVLFADKQQYATIFNSHLALNTALNKPNEIRYDFDLIESLENGFKAKIHTDVVINSEVGHRSYIVYVRYFVNDVSVKCFNDGEILNFIDKRIKNLFMQMDITHEEFSELVNENYQMN